MTDLLYLLCVFTDYSFLFFSFGC